MSAPAERASSYLDADKMCPYIGLSLNCLSIINLFDVELRIFFEKYAHFRMAQYTETPILLW
jgi:hypothetical protein